MPSVYKQNTPTESDLNFQQMKQTAQSQIQNNLANGYKPNTNVQQSYANWQTAQQSKPVDYSSTYTQQLDNLMNQVMNRPKFSYDVNQDALYRQARDQYMLNGRRAMKDTIGQASTMTGGYGNSYAASAGNQAYQQYLTQLAGMMPEFYDRARQAYNDEGDRLAQQYNLVGQREAQDYNRYRDTVSDWNADVDRALQTYNTLFNQDYGQYSDQLSNAYNALGQAQSAEQWAKDYALNQQKLDMQQTQYDQQQASNIALQLLSSGQMPSEDLLAQAGISSADAKAFIKAWDAAHPAPVAAAASSSGSSNTKPKSTTTSGSGTGLNLGKILEGVGGLASNIWNSVSSVVNPIKKNTYGSIT